MAQTGYAGGVSQMIQRIRAAGDESTIARRPGGFATPSEKKRDVYRAADVPRDPTGQALTPAGARQHPVNDRQTGNRCKSNGLGDRQQRHIDRRPGVHAEFSQIVTPERSPERRQPHMFGGEVISYGPAGFQNLAHASHGEGEPT